MSKAVFKLRFPSAVLVAVLSLPMIGPAQETALPPNKPNLANDQDAIRARYRRFNLTLQQMAEILRKQDPERADLLFRALGKSQESRVEDQMNLIFSLLNKEQPQLGEAIERQEELVAQLKTLLELLQSEDRRSEIEKEKLRLQELLKDINKLLGKEKDVRAGTERGDDPKKLADKQAEIEKQAGNLEQKIDKQDAEKNGEANPKSQISNPKSGDKPKDSKPDDKGTDDKKSDDKKADDKNGEKSDGKKADKSKHGSKSQPMPSDKNQKGKPKDGSQDDSPMPP